MSASKKFNDGRWGLTLAELKLALLYDPGTGEFFHLKSTPRGGFMDPAGELKPSGYVLVSVGGHRYRAHRLAWFYMTGTWPERDLDHRDTIRNHNAWTNLREATLQQNGANSTIRRLNTSGFKGVYWNKQRGKWAAKINPDRRQVHLGFFVKIEEAAAAYVAGATRYFGDFARA